MVLSGVAMALQGKASQGLEGGSESTKVTTKGTQVMLREGTAMSRTRGTWI